MPPATLAPPAAGDASIMVDKRPNEPTPAKSADGRTEGQPIPRGKPSLEQSEVKKPEAQEPTPSRAARDRAHRNRPEPLRVRGTLVGHVQAMQRTPARTRRAFVLLGSRADCPSLTAWPLVGHTDSTAVPGDSGARRRGLSRVLLTDDRSMMSAADSTDSSGALKDLRVAFAGKLGGMTKREAQNLVRNHGGTPVDTLSRRCGSDGDRRRRTAAG